MPQEYVVIYNGDLLGNITSVETRMATIPLCPDLLDYELIGAADNMRGRVVRAFFWIMRIWPTE